MQRSKTRLFEKGDQLICVHDIQDVTTGDVCLVREVCDDCLGLILEGHQLHYEDSCFDKYSPEKKFHFQHDPDKIDKQKVINVFNDLLKVVVLNSHRGVFTIDPFVHALVHNVKILGLSNDFKMPTNKPDDI